MATAAKIDILLDANTAALKKGFAETNQSINRLGKGMSGNVAKGMLKAHAAIAAVTAAFVGLRGAINGVMNAITEMAATQDFADRLGMGVTQLEALRYAAEQSGASAGTLDMALQRMTRRIGQAAQGSGEMVKVLDKYGLSAKALAELDSDQQLLILADAFNQAGTQGEFLADIMATMDTEGVALAEMLRRGSDGLQEMAAQAEAAGMPLEEHYKLAQTAAAEIKALSSQWEYFKRVLAAYVIPPLRALLRGLTWLIEKLQWITRWSKEESTADPVLQMAEGSFALADGMSNAAKKAKKVKKEVEDVKKVADKVRIRGLDSALTVKTSESGGFSALVAQDRKRARREAQYHAEVIAALGAINVSVQNSSVVVQPVNL